MNRPDISRLNHNRSIYLKIGFVVAIGLMILAFQWEVNAPQYTDYEVEDEPAEIVKTIIRTVQKKKKVLPPPKVKKVSNEIEAVEASFAPEPEPEPVEILTDEMNESTVEKPTIAIPKIKRPKPPKRESKVPPIVVRDFAQHMPRFPGCEDQGLSKEELKHCSEKAMFEFITREINYPTMAKETGIEGKVHLQFVVNEDGKISDIEILRDAGGGLGKESMRVISKMPDWIPGRNMNQTVKVRMRIPIKYTLEKF